MKERWKEYDGSDMAFFQRNRLMERDIVFGKKDIAEKLMNKNGNSQNIGKETTNIKAFDSLNSNEKTKNILKIGIFIEFYVIFFIDVFNASFSLFFFHH